MYKAAEDFKRFYEEITAEGLHPHNIEMAYWAMVGHEKALKSCILQEQMEEEGGYSGNRGRYTVRGEYSRGGYSGHYDDGDSYRRRDDRGRYTRDGGRSMDGGYSGDEESYGRHWVRGHYSRDEGRSDMVERIRRMMEGADPEERKAAERMIRNMEM